ncbi:C45 family peptidase [Neorhizobium sp. NCHU2750]|uniref:C45 family autoproteolytic acyltransferase/hydolase n=1 Tax=Neorhizobium sp. NCHU2750 TaxID=1825976 RepID=UPI000E71049F|nr:hypothetical protein NCHU2750_12540 [Neorhizobium sp. NCHU2750]
MIKRFPIIVFTGEPFERGRQHGTVFASLIRDKLAALGIGHATSAALLRQHQTHAQNCWRNLDCLAPDIKREMEGIAAGCDVSAPDIFMLNSFEFFPHRLQTGCSSLAIAAPKRAIIGQNWDAAPGTAEGLTLMIHRDGNEKFALVSSPGMLGWVGVNQHGLGFVTNDLMTDMATVGMPSLIARRLILGYKSIADAVRLLGASPHLSGRCYLLTDASLRVVGAELSPAGGLALIDQDRILHTNHPLTAQISAVEDRALSNAIYPSSRSRLEVLSCNRNQLTRVGDFETVLASRDGAPDAVCKSLSAREQTETAFSIVYDVTARNVRLCLGRPDQSQYYSFALSSLI